MAICLKCGADGSTGRFCSYCGAEIPGQSVPPAVNVNVNVQSARDPAGVGETDILSDPLLGVQITSARAILAGTTFAVANITSVDVRMRPPDRKNAIFTALGGIFVSLLGAGGESNGLVVVGLAVTAGGIFWTTRAKAIYYVVVGTAGGQVNAIYSHGRNQMTRVAAALNNAIVHRG